MSNHNERQTKPQSTDPGPTLFDSFVKPREGGGWETNTETERKEQSRGRKAQQLFGFADAEKLVRTLVLDTDQGLVNTMDEECAEEKMLVDGEHLPLVGREETRWTSKETGRKDKSSGTTEEASVVEVNCGTTSIINGTVPGKKCSGGQAGGDNQREELTGGTGNGRGMETKDFFLLGTDGDLDGVDQEVHNNCDEILPMYVDGSLEEEPGRCDALEVKVTGPTQTSSSERETEQSAKVVTTDNLENVDSGGQGNNGDKMLAMRDERGDREEGNGLKLLGVGHNETRTGRKKKDWFGASATCE